MKKSETCFLSVHLGYPVNDLAQELSKEGYRLIIPDDIPSHSGSFFNHVSSLVRSCDLFLAILNPDEPNSSRYLEVGLAIGFGKKTLIIAPFGTGDLLAELSEIPVIRLEPNNYPEIVKSLRQVDEYGKRPSRGKYYNFNPSKPLGRRVDQLRGRLEKLQRPTSARDTKIEKELADIVSSAIKMSGVVASSEAVSRTSRPDLVLWSDELQPVVGNPLLIEIKSQINSESDFQTVSKQLTTYMEHTQSRWTLLLYLDSKLSRKDLSRKYPNIIPLSIEEFLSRLESTSFGSIVRDLRNKQVHGIYE